jgi:hypothetical protein
MSLLGALADIRAAWHILKVNGYMLGHDCYFDQDDGVYSALMEFTREYNVQWSILRGTNHMFMIRKK